jgi:hypothetical protein
VYFDQPGHTYDQKPALPAYDRGPDDWPLCPACQALVDEADAEFNAINHRNEGT